MSITPFRNHWHNKTPREKACLHDRRRFTATTVWRCAIDKSTRLDWQSVACAALLARGQRLLTDLLRVNIATSHPVQSRRSSVEMRGIQTHIGRSSKLRTSCDCQDFWVTQGAVVRTRGVHISALIRCYTRWAIKTHHLVFDYRYYINSGVSWRFLPFLYQWEEGWTLYSIST